MSCMDIIHNGDCFMKNTCKKNSELPFKCRWVCVSLIGGSLALVVIYSLYYVSYISIETAIGLAMGIFVLIAIYESYLFFRLTLHMSGKINKNIESS